MDIQIEISSYGVASLLNKTNQKLNKDTFNRKIQLFLFNKYL